VTRIVLLGLLITAVVGVPASAAPRWWSPPAPSVNAHAWAGSARQGGTLLVAVEVRVPRRLARRGVTPVATAVVHFASGDVSVDLAGRARAPRGHRFGHHAWWAPSRAWRGGAGVPVAANEQVGRVAVDVTVTVGDGSVTVTTFGRIRKARGNPPTEQEPQPDPDPDQPCTAGCQEL
jgi:hypothetical protein